MTTIRWILFLLQIGALWLMFSGQVDAQWFSLIIVGQGVALGLAITIMRMQRKSKAADKMQMTQPRQMGQPRQRRKSTFHPSQPVPLHTYQAASPYEEQPQAMYADQNE